MENDGASVDKQQRANDEKDVMYPTASPLNDSVPEGSCHACHEPSVNKSDGILETQPEPEALMSRNKHNDQGMPPDSTETPDNAISNDTAVDAKHPVHPSSDSLASTMSPPPSLGSEAKVDENLDELVGLGDNVIVERSPGGRYVRFMEKLGSGASKDVYRAYDTQEGIEVAWNVVNLLGIPKTDRNRIVNEVRLLEQLHHQNIISFHGSWVNRERQEVIFVTEILSSGTLKSFIKKVQVIRWKIAKRWAVQILNGLEYLHSRDPPVIHRDLKCENIFINGASGDLRIGDFGLSTLYRNGTVRSVLGTPEFMAPDMYEETSYDEKVDIYAFGMCLLEIFTKEIPYAECSNPAQIYKKVSAGEPPEVLCRLRSRHAREFVELCLGHKEEATGKFIRPTATELLTHPFLVKRASDDDEVEVEPPLRERGIVEENETQSMSSPVSVGKSSAPTDSSRVTTGISNCKSHPSSSVATIEKESVATSRVRGQSTGSFDDDECDRFEQMPESEINIRNVKVYMGRGQELKEDEIISDPQHITKEQGDPDSPPADPAVGHHLAASSTFSPLTTSTASLSSNITEMGTNGLSPYVSNFPIVAGSAPQGGLSNQASDIRQFVVTLPLDGQTQNVQFDFHLVNDDPVQVANEMVTELGLPSDAALGIAAIIRSLASEAGGDKSANQPPLRSDRRPESAQFHMIAQPPQAVGAPVQQAGQLISAMISGQPVQGIVLAPEQPTLQETVSPQVVLQPTYNANLDYGLAGPLEANRLQNMAEAIQPQNMIVNATDGVAVAAAAAVLAHVSMQAPVAMQNFQSQEASIHHVTQYPPLSYNSAPDCGVPVTVSSQMQNPNPAVPTIEAHAPIPMQFVQDQLGSLAPVHDLSSAHSSARSTPTPMATHLPLIAGAPPVMSPLLAQVPTAAQAPLNPAILPGNVDLQGESSTSAFQRTISGNFLSSMSRTESFSLPGVNCAPVIASQQQPQIVSLETHAWAPVHYSNPINGGQIPPVQPMSAPQMYGLQGNITNISLPTTPLRQPVQGALTPLVQPLTAGITSSHAVQSVYESAAFQSTTAAQVPSSIQNTLVPTVNNVYSTNQYHQPLSNATYTPIASQDYEKYSSLDGDDGEFLSEDESIVADELRKLDEDYQKNLLRTKKVFDSRMDNLQRSLVEREVQHLRTLEKHEKDRAAFERRVQQEEVEHSRRIEQLQREWDEKREMLARQKQLGGLRSRKPSADGLSLSPASGGVRSHSTSPIYHPDLLGTATTTNLDNMTRPPFSHDGSTPKLD